MKKSLFKFLLKTGVFQNHQISPVFKLKIGKQEKIVNTYILASKQHHYNYECIIEKNTEMDFIIQALVKEKSIGIGKILFDDKKEEQKIQLIDSKKKKIGILQISLKKIQKKSKPFNFKIQLISGSYSIDGQSQSKIDPFLLIKLGDTHMKSNIDQNTGKQPKWNQSFDIKATDEQNIFIQSWHEDNKKQYQFLGLTVIKIQDHINSKNNYDVNNSKQVKIGDLLIRIFQQSSSPPIQQKPLKIQQQQEVIINDKNIINLKQLKIYVLDAFLKGDNQNKKDSYVKIQVQRIKPLTTTPIYSQAKNPKWNQSFQLKLDNQKVIKFDLCEKDEKGNQTVIGFCEYQINQIENKKTGLDLKSKNSSQIGKLYLEFEADWIKEKDNNAQQSLKKNMNNQASGRSANSDSINKKINEMKSKLNKMPLHEYLNKELNSVLQEGLIKIAKEKPSDPVKQLGLFLVNYKK